MKRKKERKRKGGEGKCTAEPSELEFSHGEEKGG